jgi:hypothetical protein
MRDGMLEMMVKAQPRSRRAGLRGLVASADGPRLVIGVAEAPESGRANRAVCVTLAEALGVPQSNVALAHGAASREKRLRIAGDPAALSARLEALLR